jgi:hypothetical protein
VTASGAGNWTFVNIVKPVTGREYVHFRVQSSEPIRRQVLSELLAKHVFGVYLFVGHLENRSYACNPQGFSFWQVLGRLAVSSFRYFAFLRVNLWGTFRVSSRSVDGWLEPQGRLTIIFPIQVTVENAECPCKDVGICKHMRSKDEIQEGGRMK